jgi:hypothetical protein
MKFAEKNKKVRQITDTYIQAILKRSWDYPAGSKFTSKEEIYTLVSEGKTIYGFMEQAVIHYGSVTTGMLAIAGIPSTSCSKAIKKAVAYALQHSGTFQA